MMGRKHKQRAGDICTIVVHAGAGYHSIANQDVHLKACSDACVAAMAALKNGATAVEAVEIAVKVLEDREITNAGYGSNLAIDGVVECDALVVDHMGRSGAVGACPQIKNPVSLARLVLDKSLVQLTLRRVPPNLLVGQGAVDFAFEAGVPVLPYDALVSPGARERWLRWTKDLERAELKQRHKSASPPPFTFTRPPVDPIQRDIRDNAAREAHTRSMLQNPNKRRRISESTKPLLQSSRHASAPTPESGTTDEYDSDDDDSGEESEFIDVIGPPGSLHEASASALINSSQNIPTLLTLEDDRVVETWAPSIEGSADERKDEDMIDNPVLPLQEEMELQADSEEESSDTASDDSTLTLPSLTPSPQVGPMSHGAGFSSHRSATSASEHPIPPPPLEQPESPSPAASTPLRHVTELPPLPPTPSLPSLTQVAGPLPHRRDEDHITDTVGAIAIDSHGNIACGASSGGIGMKHRGRIGPAALVGVGAAVVPVHPNDKSRTCISAVTSGTGEHMGTTLAASVCADRLYSSMQKSNDGPLEPASEEKVLRSFIEREFMMHPSVKSSNSAGAIGIVSLKKTRDGVELYFAHNTDSFVSRRMPSLSDPFDPAC
jgi:taspase (threonine aspartase 1)